MKSFKAYKFTTINCTSFRNEIEYLPCTTFKCNGKLRLFYNGIHFGTTIMDALECCPDEIDRNKIRLFEVDVNGEYVACETKSGGFYGCTSSLRFVREVSFDEMLTVLKAEIDIAHKIFSSDKKDVHSWIFNMLYIYSKLFRKPIDFNYLNKTSNFCIGEKIIIKNITDLKYFNLPWFEWWKEFRNNLSPSDFIHIKNMTNHEYFSLVTGIDFQTAIAYRNINDTKQKTTEKKVSKTKQRKGGKNRKSRKVKNDNKKEVER